MSIGFVAISWNSYKKKYDVFLIATCLAYLSLFTLVNMAIHPIANMMTVLIRAFGTLALILLHVILLIGPAARLSVRFLPLLYNRRHLGVTMFLMGSIHGMLSLFWFHGGGDVNPFVSLFTSNKHYGSLSFFPFQTLGFFALVILMLMALTSHDFWLNIFGTRIWKGLHMMVYGAYVLLIAHVSLGSLQSEKNPLFAILLLIGASMVSAIHILAFLKEKRAERTRIHADPKNWVLAGSKDEFIASQAKILRVDDQRIAIFNNEGRLSAVHNVCKHQMGPLGEGKIVDGCIVCPWHGFQYHPEDGCSPPPFQEKLHTYKLKQENDLVFIDPIPLPEGTHVEPLQIYNDVNLNYPKDKFFIGWDSARSLKFSSTSQKFAIAIAGCMIVIGLLIPAFQQHPSPYVLDYGTKRQIEGWLLSTPVPMIRIMEGKDMQGNPIYKDVLLVDALKFGALAKVNRYEITSGKARNMYVRLKGYLSQRYVDCGYSPADCDRPCSQCLIGTRSFPLMEIGEDGLLEFSPIPEPYPMVDEVISSTFRDTLLFGEIIDPKCYFGAMNPGQGKTHLSCAARCISGGIMPLLHYVSSGADHYVILTGHDGVAVNGILRDKVAMPVSIKGKWAKMDNWELMQMDPMDGIVVLKN